MRNYLLSKNILYKTKLTKQEVLNRLANNIEKESFFDFSSYDYKKPKSYEGTINGTKFKARRVINYRNAFLPTIRGEVFTDSERTKIKVNMKTDNLIFIGICMNACFFSWLLQPTSMKSEFIILPFIPLILIIFIFGTFKGESKKSIEDFKRILEADIE